MKFLEFKNKIYAVKYSLHGFKIRFDTAEYIGEPEQTGTKKTEAQKLSLAYEAHRLNTNEQILKICGIISNSLTYM